MGVKLGSGDVSFRLGSATPAKVALGSAEVWTPPPTDPDFASVSLLLHFDSDFGDSSTHSHVVSVLGDTEISVVNSKFGGGAAYFDGSSDYLTVPSDSSLDLSTGDFTIEMWAYLVEQSNIRPALIGNAASYPGSGSEFAILWDSSYGDDGITVEGASLNLSTAAIAKDQWHHIAVVRSAGTLTIFIDGSAEASAAFGASVNLAQGGDLLIGRHWDGTDSDYQEFIDELRITKGVARYLAAFTPPAAPFPDSGP